MFTCKECNKSFTQKSYFKNHIDVIHKKISGFRCHICSKLFTTKQMLEYHLISPNVHHITNTIVFDLPNNQEESGWIRDVAGLTFSSLSRAFRALAYIEFLQIPNFFIQVQPKLLSRIRSPQKQSCLTKYFDFKSPILCFWRSADLKYNFNLYCENWFFYLDTWLRPQKRMGPFIPDATQISVV